MKYLPLREFGGIANALNFSTPDYHVIGGCDVYTTKAAGGDKKLYKNIEESLESQYESLVRLSASLSPPRRRESDEDKGSRKRRNTRGMSVGVPEIFLSRASPFGPLSQISARRTFAYMIATLNASHPDYDFSHTLRPDDFRKERSLRGIMQNVDTTLMNLRPRSQAALAGGGGNYLAPPTRGGLAVSGAEIWSPKCWDLIDKEMGLRSCEKYSYAPDDDPFDEDEGCIWSLHYFFFSKERRRVCYLYLRGLSVISHSPVHVPMLPVRRPARRTLRKASSVTVGDGAGKRASYWLGAKAARGGALLETEDEGDDDEMVYADESAFAAPGDDEVDEVPYMDLDDIRRDLAQGFFSCDAELDLDGWYAEDEDIDDDDGAMGINRPRGVSEGVMEMMEL